MSFTLCPLFIFRHLNEKPSSHSFPLFPRTPCTHPFSPALRAPHIQPYRSQIQLASIPGFSIFCRGPGNIAQIFISATSGSLIKRGKITLIENTFNWSDISTFLHPPPLPRPRAADKKTYRIIKWDPVECAPFCVKPAHCAANSPGVHVHGETPQVQ